MNNEQRKRGNSFNFVICYLLFIICSLLFGCYDIFNDSRDALQPGYGRVAVTIKGASARTVFPMMAFAKYEYLFAKVIDGLPGEPEAQEPADGYFTLKLGDWQVTVNAYVTDEDDDPAVTGTSATFTVSDEAIAHIVIQLGTVEAGGFGSFSYHITYPENAEISVFTLENLINGYEINISGSEEAEGTVFVLSGISENVPAGYYYLTIELMENERESRTAGANEVVYIYDNLESEYSVSFTSKDFSHIHEWGDWTEADAPTETEDGLETKICARDLMRIHTEERTLYATGTQGLRFELAWQNNYTTYRVSRGTASGTIHIPAMHRPDAASPYLPVTEIGNFDWSPDPISINIPAGVTSIDGNAFNGCIGLTGITVDKDNQHYASEDGILYNKAKTQLIAAPGAISGMVIIPEGVRSIGNEAFYNCNNLTGITLPESLTSIGNSVFSNCSGLENITIPASVTSISESAFQSCYNLTEITVNGNNQRYASEEGILYNKAKTQLITAPEAISGIKNIPTGVTSIDNSAFSNCRYLTGIILPAGVTTIGENAFYYCTDLNSISLPASLTSIGNSAFSNCTGLNSISFPASLTSIGDSAFSNCTGLNSISFPASLTSIGDSAFSNCYSLTDIIIPVSVRSIGSYAFSGCSSLIDIAIPASVTSIGEGAFEYCTRLSSITVAGNNPSYTSEGSILYNKTKTRVIAVAPAGIHGDITIPAGITSIGSKAFYNCTGLTGINLSVSGVTEIGYEAFSGCTNLTGINIPANVTTIGYSAFSHCSSLTGITLPAGLTSIGDSAFSNCSSLTNIEIPVGVSSINEDMFYNCTSLSSITVSGNNQYYASEGGILYNKAKTQLIIAPAGINGDISIPSGVISIGSRAFNNCTGITGITFPASVMSIGSYAFSNCTGLTSINIPASVTSIDYYAFYGWIDAQTINILGHGNQAAAEDAWGQSWKDNCGAVIKYLGISIDNITAQFWRENAAVSLTAPQINAIGWTITAQGWQISDNGSGGWSNFTPPSTAAMSYNGKYLRYYITISGSTYYSNTASIRVYSSDVHYNEVTVAMWDSYSDGWDGAGALRIVVNTTEIASNVKPSGGSASYTFTVNSGDVVYFYWIEGGAQSENAFVVYYSDDPPSPAFNPANGAAVDTGRILLYRQYNTMDYISDGALLGSFTVP